MVVGERREKRVKREEEEKAGGEKEIRRIDIYYRGALTE